MNSVTAHTHFVLNMCLLLQGVKHFKGVKEGGRSSVFISWLKAYIKSLEAAKAFSFVVFCCLLAVCFRYVS